MRKGLHIFLFLGLAVTGSWSASKPHVIAFGKWTPIKWYTGPEEKQSLDAKARALFVDGKLFPNTELGHLELRGMDAEKWASAYARSAERLDFPAWIARVNEYLLALHKLLWPDVFILGGAVSERFAEFAPLLRSPAELRPAHFAGHAGVVGAAMAAAEAPGRP